MFIFKKSNLIITAVLIVTAITFVICIGALQSAQGSSTSVSGIKVVIDAGHGGIDGGVVGVSTGVKESKLNLAVAKKLEKCFVSAGIDVVLTRPTDAGLYGTATKNFKRKDMERRRDIINEAQPTLVISVHMNRYSVSSRRGAQVFFDNGSEGGKLLSACIQKSLNGMEEAVRECNALTGDYFILNSHEFPACIVECGFLSNPEDEALLITDEYQEKIAYAVFKGAIEYLTETSSYLQCCGGEAA